MSRGFIVLRLQILELKFVASDFIIFNCMTGVVSNLLLVFPRRPEGGRDTEVPRLPPSEGRGEDIIQIESEDQE